MLKILQARLQQYVNHELPDVQAGFTKGRGTRDQIANICWIIGEGMQPTPVFLPGESQGWGILVGCRLWGHTETWLKQLSNASTSASLTTSKPLTMWITTTCWKFFKRWEYQTNLPASWEICMQVKKQQNQTWNNRLVPNWERSMSRQYTVTQLI